MQPKDTPNIEKTFKDISADAFSRDTSLQGKVKIIAQLHQELKAYNRHVAKEILEKKFEDVSALEDKVKTIAKLIRSLKGRANRAVKKIAKDFEKIVKLNQEFKDIFQKNSSLENKVKVIVELHQELKVQKGRKDEVKIIAKLIQSLEGRMGRAIQKIAQDFEKVAGFKHKYEGKDVFTNEKAAEFEISKKSQTILEGKISDQNKQEKTSVQTDKIHASVSKADTPRRAASENKNFEQKKISVQTDTVQPSVSKDPIKDKPHDKKLEISLKQVSVDRNATEKKSNNKKPQLSEKKNIAQPQEKQKEEGFLRRFFKKFLEYLFGEDEMSVKDMKEKSTSNDEGQQKNKLFLSQGQNTSEDLKQVNDPSITPINTTAVKKTNTDRER